MALTQNGICAFGWKAKDFALRGIDGRTYSLAGPRARLSFSSATTVRI